MSNNEFCSRQISEPIFFQSKSSGKITLTPYLINFKLAKLNDELHKNSHIVPGVLTTDLLHSVAALYNVSLPEMSPDTIYEHLSEHAKTIVLLQDIDEIINSYDYTTSINIKENNIEIISSNGENIDENEIVKDVCPSHEPPDNFFRTVFSDNESLISENEESDDEENNEEEDFSLGCNKFVKEVMKRRKTRLENKDLNRKCIENFGIENRIAAAMTFSKKYIVKSQETVHHLTFLATRPKLRKKFGLGKYLLNILKDKQISGSYDAIVVHADNDAKLFFLRFGFTDDIILNSRYGDLMEQFTNCTLMTYLPSFSDKGLNDPVLDLTEMDKQMNKWRLKNADCFQEQSLLFQRMQREIIHLKALTVTQRNIIDNLESKCTKLENEKLELTRDFCEYKLTSQSLNSANNMKNKTILKHQERLDQLLKKQERGKGDTFIPLSNEILSINNKFEMSVKSDPFLSDNIKFKITSIRQEPNKNCNKLVAENINVKRLYFYSNKVNDFEKILIHGFLDEDCEDLSLGDAFHFTEYPSIALKSFTKNIYQLLYAKVEIKSPAVNIDDKIFDKQSEYLKKLNESTKHEIKNVKLSVVFNKTNIKDVALIDFEQIIFPNDIY